jgi:hypothetical protein
LAQYRQIASEITRALMVLALVFFGLSQGATASAGQVGASPAVAASIAQTAASDYCGGGWGDNQMAHAPCHACRSSAPMLPPPPCVAEPVSFNVVPVTYPEPTAAVWVRPSYGQALSRAPPLV